MVSKVHFNESKDHLLIEEFPLDLCSIHESKLWAFAIMSGPEAKQSVGKKHDRSDAFSFSYL